MAGALTTPGTGGVGYVVARDIIGTGTAPTTNDGVQYVKLDAGTTSNSTPVNLTSPLPTQGGGGTTASVPSGAANTIVKASAGRICKILVTTAGTGTGNVLIYDNATTNTGTVIAIVPATIAIGTLYTFDMPAANGLVVQNVASGPVLTISYY